MKFLTYNNFLNSMRYAALCALACAACCLNASHAAVINIADVSGTPDGSATTFGENYDVETANGGNKILVPSTDNVELAYIVTTFTFGAGSLADIGIGFDQDYVVPDNDDRSPSRAGIIVNNNGVADLAFGFGPQEIDLVQPGSMAGQTITLIIEFDYDKNRSTTNNDDTLLSFWVNPTGSSTAGAPTVAGSQAYNSNNFPELILYIKNNSTPGTAGTSTITNTTLLTLGDASFANALALATIPEPNTAMLVSLAGLSLLLRRRRS